MNVPGNSGDDLEKAKDETRLCFGTAGVCTAVGALGWGFNLVFSTHYPLPALMVVGALYALMGTASSVKVARMQRAARLKLDVIESTLAKKPLGTTKDG